MLTSRKTRFTRTVIAALLAGAAGSAMAAVGTKVIVQSWEPWNDNRQPTMIPINDPQFISGPLLDAWADMRRPLCDLIRGVVGKPDLVHRGITFYNTSCELNALDIRLVPLAQNRAKLVVLLPRSRLAATATTPNLRQLGADIPIIGGLGLPGGTDPRFAVSIDAQLELDVEIGDAPQPFLTVRRAHFELNRADARGENITGKLAEWVASRVIPFFGGPDFERMIEATLDDVRWNFTGRMQQAVRTINARIAPFAQYARVGTWISDSRIAIALQPRSLPVFRFDGEVRGAVSTARTAIGQPGSPVDCAGFRVTAEYQAAPAPIVNPDTLALGPAKRLPAGTLAGVQTLPDGSCAYAMRGLAAGVTNYLRAAHAAERNGTGKLAGFSVALKPSGWDGVRVNPRPLQANLNYVLVGGFAGHPAPRIDPVIVQHTHLDGRGSSGAAALRAMTDARAPNPQPLPPRQLTPGVVGGNVSLNPQPLPPRTPLAVVPAPTPPALRAGPSGAVAAIGAAQALNPQPLPPRGAPIPSGAIEAFASNRRALLR